jgi:Protein of unknown function (DUF1559)/Dockerin type I domain
MFFVFIFSEAIMSRPIRPFLRQRSLAAAIDCLESRWMMATTTPDTFLLQSHAPTYDQPYFFEAAQPAVASMATGGKSAFDLRTNTPGDQTISIDSGVGARIRVDPLASYQFTFIAQASEGNLTFESFDELGFSLGMTSVPYDYVTPEDAYYRLVTARGVIGPSGRMLPANTAIIEFSPQLYAMQFGFLEDQVFSFVTNGFVDRRQAPIPLRVDLANPLTISYQAIRNTFTATPQLHTLGFESLDVDSELIEGVHVERYAGATDTYLAESLNPGDTSFVVQSTKGWSNQSPDARTRALAWYGYRDSTGTLYPDYSYTRNVARDNIEGLWDQGAIVGNRITLRKPWAGAAIPNGTAVRNAVDSDSLIPTLLNNGSVAQSGNATIAGVWQKGQRQSNQFPPGTASIRLASLMNQSPGARDEAVTVQMRYGLPAPGFSIGTTVDNRRMVELDVLANDTSSSALVIRSATQGVRGSVSIVPGNGIERSKLRYTSPQYFIGSDFFSYTVFDPQTGTESTEQVFLESLGGNLDQDATLRETIRVNSLVPKSLQGEIYLVGNAVKNERFIPEESDVVRYPLGSGTVNNTYVTLSYLANQSGSLNLLPSGKFDFVPVKDFVGAVPFVVGYHNGSDQRLGTGSLTVFGDHFSRDQSRLATIGLAERNYESAYKRLFYPSNVPVDTNNKPFLSWRVYALPYMGFDSLFNRFRLNEPWNSPNNLPLLSEMPSVFRSGNDSASVTTTRYLVIASGAYPSSVPLFLNNANSLGNSLSLNRVTDGTSNTMLVVQAATEKAIPWTKPDDLAFDEANPISTLGNVGSYFNAVFADGKVRALPTDMGNPMFRSMATISDGDFLLDPASLTRAAKLRADFPGDPITYDDNYQTKVMKDLTLAMLNHESAYKRFAPPGPSTSKSLSWRVYLLPYLEQMTLFNQFRLDEPWDSQTNLAAAEKMPDIFRSLGDSPKSTLTRFRVLGGPNMAYGLSSSLNQGPRLNDFVDGTSNSILMVEAGADNAVPWTKPDVMPIADENIWNSLGTFAKPFMLVGMADGSTLRIPTSTPPDNVRGLATINLGDAGRSEYDIAVGVSKSTNSFLQLNDLKQLGLGVLNFASAFKRIPNDFLGNVTQLASGSVGLSWRVAILPYIEEGTLYNRFHLDEPWDSSHNLSLLPLMPSIFKTATDTPSSTTTRVQRFQGRNTIDPKQRMRLADITDGNSNTVLAGLSAPEKAVPWTKPADMEFSDVDGWEVLGRNVRHTPVVMADGYVKELDRSIGNVVFNALVRRNDGLALSDYGDPNVDPVRTLVLREGDAIDAITVSGQMRAIVDFDTPGLAYGFVKSDGYNRGLGASLQVGAIAVDNGILDGKRQTKLNVRVPSNPDDPNSPWKLLYAIDVIVLDNDFASIQTDTVVPLTVAEGNATEVWIHLGAQPTANVTVTATQSDTTEVAISNRTLVFTPSDWFLPQRVIVEGVVDSILDGDIDSEIQFAVTTSTDTAYAASSPLVIPVTTRDNHPATLNVLDTVTTLSEDTAIASRMQTGRINVVDDGIGINTISLSGRDADFFLLEDNILYLRAGTLLDFETKPTLRVSVSVDDPTIGSTPDQSIDVIVNVTDINEAPTEVVFTNTILRATEEITLAEAMVIADISVMDDALGTRQLSLKGPDEGYFEIVNSKLKIKAGARFNFEVQSSLQVRVEAKDPTLANSTPVFRDFTLSIDNVPEVTSVQVIDGSGWNSSVRQVRISWDTLATLFDTAIEWKKRDVDNATVSYVVQTSVINNRTVADVRFEGKYLDAVGLVDGIYDLVVLGERVTGSATSLKGLNHTESFVAIRPKPDFAMTIALDSPVAIGSRVSIPVQLIGLNDVGNGIRYEADFDGDGIVDRTLLGRAEVTFSDIAFDQGGSRTITIKAMRSDLLLSQGSLVVDVLPYTSRGSRWTSTLDVDADETVSPLDALAVINWLNDTSSSRHYVLNLDVDRDSSISPLDVLTVINHINSSSGSVTSTPFSSLSMNDTGTPDGLTSNVGIRGTVKDPDSKLYLSLDGSAKKEAVGAVASDGQFELTDSAISQFFGQSLEGDHVLTIGSMGGNGVWQGLDRRFSRIVRLLSPFEIKSALQNRGVFLEWGSSGAGARYRIIRSIAGQPSEILADELSSLSAKIDLPTGNHELFIEAYDRVGNVERTPTLRVTVV